MAKKKRLQKTKYNVSTLVYRKRYKDILTKHRRKQRLAKTLHKAFEDEPEGWRFNCPCFTIHHACYEHEAVTLAKYNPTGFTYLLYTNCYTACRRRITLDRDGYNRGEEKSLSKAMREELKPKRGQYALATPLFLDLFDLHVLFFQDDESLDFSAYCDAIGKAEKGAKVSVYPARSGMPRVFWSCNGEHIDLCSLPGGGLDISHSVPGRGIGYRLLR